MKNIWEPLNFSQNPYDIKAIAVNDRSNIFFGRYMEANTFRSLISSGNGCVLIIGGEVGVGKSSFFNYQQTKILHASDESLRIVPDYYATAISEEDSAINVAMKMTLAIVNSIRQYAKVKDEMLPVKVEKIWKWISHEPDETGNEFGINLGGIGGSSGSTFQPVNINSLNLRHFSQILTEIVDAIKTEWKVDGLFVALDNLEKVQAAKLQKTLMEFRDTVFLVKGVWFVLIGQETLHREISQHNKSISEHIKRRPVLIKPFENSELHELIKLRVREYGNIEDAEAPLSEQVHDIIFRASKGITRTALEISSSLIEDLVISFQNVVDQEIFKSSEQTEQLTREERKNESIKELITSGSIPDITILTILLCFSITNFCDLLLSSNNVDLGSTALKLIPNSPPDHRSREGYMLVYDLINKKLSSSENHEIIVKLINDNNDLSMYKFLMDESYKLLKLST